MARFVHSQPRKIGLDLIRWKAAIHEILRRNFSEWNSRDAHQGQATRMSGEGSSEKKVHLFVAPSCSTGLLGRIFNGGILKFLADCGSGADSLHPLQISAPPRTLETLCTSPKRLRGGSIHFTRSRPAIWRSPRGPFAQLAMTDTRVSRDPWRDSHRVAAIVVSSGVP